MPIAGVGRVEPMDPDVKREVVRRARESGTFATDADATWVGSPLPASVNRRVVSRDATKRPGTGPDVLAERAGVHELSARRHPLPKSQTFETPNELRGGRAGCHLSHQLADFRILKILMQF